MSRIVVKWPIFRVGGLLCFLLALAPRARALETDQFTTPPHPLVDLSEEFEVRMRQALQETVERANREYDEHVEGASATRLAFVRASRLKKARQWLEERHVVRAAYAATVFSGYPQCEMELWARAGTFERQPARFEPKPDESVFGKSGRPVTVQIMSPTINLYGVYLGTDKLGHFFQQGYEYYEVYADEMRRSGDEELAIRKAVLKGVGQENGIYGKFIDGVFSNADLAANYAGFKFYLNLTRAIVIGGRTCPSMLVLEGDDWRVNPELPRGFMRVYITDHLNEARNPSKYSKPLRPVIAKNVAARLERWMRFYGSSFEEESRRLRAMHAWQGEWYGHSGFEQLVTLVSPAR
jgi:hypothetical protein